MLVKLSKAILRCVCRATLQQDQLYSVDSTDPKRCLSEFCCLLQQSLKPLMGCPTSLANMSIFATATWVLWPASKIILIILTWACTVMYFRYHIKINTTICSLSPNSKLEPKHKRKHKQYKSESKKTILKSDESRKKWFQFWTAPTPNQAWASTFLPLQRLCSNNIASQCRFVVCLTCGSLQNFSNIIVFVQ